MVPAHSQSPKGTFPHAKLVAATVTIPALHVPQELLLHPLSSSLLLPPCPQPLLASYSPGCCFYPLLLGPAHSLLASQGLGPHLLAPPRPPTGCQGPPASRAQLLPVPGGGGHKRALVTSAQLGSLMPGFYYLLPGGDGVGALLDPPHHYAPWF